MLSVVFSVSLATAISIETNRQEYSSGDIVLIIVGGCAEEALVKVLNPTSDLIDVKEGNAIDYNTLSDRSKGKYTITASCAEGRMEEHFCVDAAGCLDAVRAADLEVAAQGATTPAAGQASSGTTSGGGGSGGGGGSRGGGGGGACQPHSTLIDRKCVCDAGYELKLNKCVLMEVPEAAAEEEDGVAEERYVSPSRAQPVPSYSPPPRSAAQQPVSRAQDLSTKSVVEESFLEKNKVYLIAIPSILILLVVLIFGLFHFFPIRPVVININELEAWIKAERQQGMSDERIRQMLRERTMWKDADINKAFAIAGQR